MCQIEIAKLGAELESIRNSPERSVTKSEFEKSEEWLIKRVREIMHLELAAPAARAKLAKEFGEQPEVMSRIDAVIAMIVSEQDG